MKKISKEIFRDLEQLNRETLLRLLKLSIEDPSEEILDTYIKARKMERYNNGK